MFETVNYLHKALRTESPWVFILAVAATFGILAGVIAWIVERGYQNDLRNRTTEGRPLANRQQLYVTLSGQREEGRQHYREVFVLELKFISADAEANNKRNTTAVRREKAEDGRKLLAELEQLQRDPLAQHQREFAATIAQIRLAFPKTQELNGLLVNVTWRPEWDIHEPQCDTRNFACMQEWANLEAKKAEDALNRYVGKIDALLAYMQAHFSD
jgi:hypothetical protein